MKNAVQDKGGFGAIVGLPRHLVTEDDIHSGRLKAATVFKNQTESLTPKTNMFKNQIFALDPTYAGIERRQFMDANTVPDGLKRQAWLLDAALTAFATVVAPLRAFSTVFNGVKLQGTNKINVPYFPLETASSTTWNASNGYVAGNTTTDTREITVDKRKYQALEYSSEELARLPAFNAEQLGAMKANKLAVDVVNDILSAVTAANFGAAAKTEPAAAFDSDDIADLRNAANVANWPEFGRSLIVNADYDVNLLKDESVKNAMNFGGSEAIRQGKVPRILGFDYYVVPSLPGNSENLTGMAVYNSALLVAFSPIKPAEEVMDAGTRYLEAVDPKTGATLSMRRFGNSTLDKATHVIECAYGYAAGEAAACKRITSA